ncbi:hypothetical protein ACRALDRAFT_2061205 [Sodiomyces alcalophilus JCM 7366]|uniref:uncharacterized protein n=1 Tax=Sodiomyces alcalophilus JCM 7366 TaxID=591952 RepID=UPI0039B41B76
MTCLLFSVWRSERDQKSAFRSVESPNAFPTTQTSTADVSISGKNIACRVPPTASSPSLYRQDRSDRVRKGLL